MPWAVNTPGGQVQLMDLPLEALEKLEADTGRRYSQLLTVPAWDAKSIRCVYAAACAHNGSDPKPLTARDLVADGNPIFVEVADDMPDVYEDGLPKAEGATPTPG